MEWSHKETTGHPSHMTEGIRNQKEKKKKKTLEI